MISYVNLLKENAEEIEKAITEAYIYNVKYGYPVSVYLWSDGEVETMEGTWTIVPTWRESRTVRTIYVANDSAAHYQAMEYESEEDKDWYFNDALPEWFREERFPQKIWNELLREAEFEEEIA